MTDEPNALRFDLRTRFQQLLGLADSLTVGLVAQEPFCADPTSASPREVYVHARREGYSAVPLVDRSAGVATHIISTEALRELGDVWPILTPATARAIGPSDLIPEKTSLFRALNRLVDVDGADRPFLLTLSDDGIPLRVVTVFDVDQPAARTLAFGLISIVEAGIGSVLRRALDGVDDAAGLIEVAERNLPPALAPVFPTAAHARPRDDVRRSLKRWQRKRAADENIDLVDTLYFATKAHLLSVVSIDGRSCLDRHAEIAGMAADAAYLELRALNELRNDAAHDRDEVIPSARIRCELIARAHYLGRGYAGLKDD